MARVATAATAAQQSSGAPRPAKMRTKPSTAVAAATSSAAGARGKKAAKTLVRHNVPAKRPANEPSVPCTSKAEKSTASKPAAPPAKTPKPVAVEPPIDPKLYLTATYLSMKRQSVRVCKIYARILALLNRRRMPDHSALVEVLGNMAWERARLGQSTQAEELFGQARDLAEQYEVSATARLGVLLLEIEFWMDVRMHEEGRTLMEELPGLALEAMREYKTRSSGPAVGAIKFKCLRARCFYVSSLVLAQSGEMQQATFDARQSLQLLRECWAAVDGEVRGSHKLDQLADGSTTVVAQMAQLSLTSGATDQPAVQSKLESLTAQDLYPLVTPLFESLQNYSDLCARQGSLTEALYYLKQAEQLAIKVKIEVLQLDCRTLMLETYVRAKDVKMAIQMLEGMQKISSAEDNGLRAVRYQCALADLFALQGQVDRRVGALEQAEEALLMALEDARVIEDGKEKMPPERILAVLSPNVRRIKKAISEGKDRNPTSSPPQTPTRTAAPEATWQHHKKLDHRRAELSRRRHELARSQDRTSQPSPPLSSITHSSSPREALRATTLAARRTATALVQSLSLDSTYCALADSVLSALPFAQPQTAPRTEPRTTAKKTATTLAKRGRARPKQAPPPRPIPMILAPAILAPLQENYTTLSSALAQARQVGNLADARELSALSAQNALLLASVEQRASPVKKISRLLEEPGMQGLRYEEQRVEIEERVLRERGPDFPEAGISSVDGVLEEGKGEELVKVLPESWTTVSMHLSDGEKELTFCRYRRDQEPFILRIPLDRQAAEYEDEGDTEQHLSFERGATEMGRIIQLANASCHTASGKEVSKASKAQWWEEREALDVRLGDLLENLQISWLGGFRGILSSRRWDEEALRVLKVALHRVLDEHLPSRRRATLAKRGKKEPGFAELDPRIVELFAALIDGTTSRNEEEDLSEEVQDLLHFIVDALQLCGERNAYDEIDFDAMIVAAQDALNTFRHAQSSVNPQQRRLGSDGHLILVLDRKLHTFPWESVPCLWGQPVSRVPSVTCIVSRIREMRRLHKAYPSSVEHNGAARDCYPLLKSRTGYILNPSQDLVSTRDRLLPLLQPVDVHGSDTSSTGSSVHVVQETGAIVDRAPTEEEFASMLQRSDIALYFGHGSGAQYIRGRRIKKLLADRPSTAYSSCASSSPTAPAPAATPSTITTTLTLPPSTPSDLHLGPTCAAALLLGCSSGTLTLPLPYEPHGPPTSYLVAGAPAVVGALWDVTDGDLDRFSEGVLGRWGVVEWRGERMGVERGRVVRRRAARGLVRRWEREMGDGGGDEAGQDGCEGGRVDLCRAVERGRGECYLRFLNGGAMVVYGVPCWVVD